VRGKRVNEDFPIQPRPWRWDSYGRAKIESERRLLRRHAAGEVEVTILRPTVIYGVGDRAVIPRIARLLACRQLVVVGSGRNRIHLIHAGDVAEAAALAATNPRAAGRTYNLDGPLDVTQRDLFDALAELIGEPRASRRLPLPVAYVAGFLGEAWGRLRDREEAPALTRYLVCLSGGVANFDSTRAAEELGWQPRISFASGLAQLRAAGATR
jgi:nucleoside-diphosphate-sugar epimerase